MLDAFGCYPFFGRKFSAEDARFPQITDDYVGQSLEAPIHATGPQNTVRTYHRLPWQLQQVALICDLVTSDQHPTLRLDFRPRYMKIDVNHVQQAPK